MLSPLHPPIAKFEFLTFIKPLDHSKTCPPRLSKPAGSEPNGCKASKFLSVGAQAWLNALYSQSNCNLKFPFKIEMPRKRFVEESLGSSFRLLGNDSIDTAAITQVSQETGSLITQVQVCASPLWCKSGSACIFVPTHFNCKQLGLIKQAKVKTQNGLCNFPVVSTPSLHGSASLVLQKIKAANEGSCMQAEHIRHLVWQGHQHAVLSH